MGHGECIYHEFRSRSHCGTVGEWGKGYYHMNDVFAADGHPSQRKVGIASRPYG